MTIEAALQEGHDPGGDATAALAAFRDEAAQTRLQTPQGAPMPEGLVTAWGRLLEAAEPGLVSSEDLQALSRLRLSLETELQADGAWFGDVPAGLAVRITAALHTASNRLAELQRGPSALDPRGLRWPLAHLHVTSSWGERVHPVDGEPRFHAGVDLEAPLDTEVFAAADGVVAFADWNGGHGRQVELSHDGRWTTRYSHLDKWLVTTGQHVQRGDVIGLVGQSGLATGPHLHFEVLNEGASMDPELLLQTPTRTAQGAQP